MKASGHFAVAASARGQWSASLWFALACPAWGCIPSPVRAFVYCFGHTLKLGAQFDYMVVLYFDHKVKVSPKFKIVELI